MTKKKLNLNKKIQNQYIKVRSYTPTDMQIYLFFIFFIYDFLENQGCLPRQSLSFANNQRNRQMDKQITLINNNGKKQTIEREK